MGRRIKLKKMWMIIALLVLIGITIFLWTGELINDGLEPKADGTNEYAILFGARVKESGVPSLALKYRLDAAIEYLNDYPTVNVIVSGGQGDDEPISEAAFMENYLVENGIEQDRILKEDQSTSTYENIVFSMKLLPEEVTQVTLISSDFHLKRAQVLADKQGLKTDVVAADTPNSVEEMMRLRERAALLKAIVMGN